MIIFNEIIMDKTSKSSRSFIQGSLLYKECGGTG